MADGFRLIYVVGASGAGKDSVIAAARAALAARGDVVVARRVVTRPAGAGGEDHETCGPEAFARRRAEGGFALAWEANGLLYGVPATIDAALAAGRAVVVNGSRGALADSRRRYPAMMVVELTAAPETLRRRLIARDRETVERIEARLVRAAALAADGDDIVRIANDGDLQDAVAALVAAIVSRLAPDAASRAPAPVNAYRATS
ncbi:MAG: phosphonate metabolism protein/1,5-bisphosphokinase (PRPP-forming) PhnN [Rhodospirillales bacterium]|nr:phosphonate metabolism protein/1,5-bisphosphokinase (PRPP-forming) PhnN [Rhodospirillales bacterium]